MCLRDARAVTVMPESGQSVLARGGARLSGLHQTKQCGFTLVELITVIVIVGVLALTALPRFFDVGTFDGRALHDRVVAMIRHAQKAAIAQRRFVCVTIASNVVTLTYDTTPPSETHVAATCAGAAALTNPETGQAPYSLAAPAGLTVDATAFSFDALGRPSVGQFITAGGLTITVNDETGYVE